MAATNELDYTLMTMSEFTSYGVFLVVGVVPGCGLLVFVRVDRFTSAASLDV